MLVKLNLADFSVSSLLVLNQDDKLPAEVETMCFLLLLSSMLSFFSLLILSSPPIHPEEMR